jgi:hypothetical protein
MKEEWHTIYCAKCGSEWICVKENRKWDRERDRERETERERERERSGGKLWLLSNSFSTYSLTI